MIGENKAAKIMWLMNRRLYKTTIMYVDIAGHEYDY